MRGDWEVHIPPSEIRCESASDDSTCYTFEMTMEGCHDAVVEGISVVAQHLLPIPPCSLSTTCLGFFGSDHTTPVKHVCDSGGITRTHKSAQVNCECGIVPEDADSIT